MPKSERKQEGDLPKKYNFVLNPYPTERLSRCPYCDGKTGQRKVPLLIHIDPVHMIALNYTCRYCKHCDLLIAHKHEVEHLLTNMFSQRDPGAIGNEYLIMGTVEKKAWREGLTQPKAVTEILSSHAHIFKTYYQELRSTRPGWYPADQEPPVMPPPPSTEWVKNRKVEK